jgi:hypothetical protein
VAWSGAAPPLEARQRTFCFLDDIEARVYPKRRNLVSALAASLSSEREGTVDRVQDACLCQAWRNAEARTSLSPPGTRMRLILVGLRRVKHAAGVLSTPAMNSSSSLGGKAPFRMRGIFTQNEW